MRKVSRWQGKEIILPQNKIKIPAGQAGLRKTASLVFNFRMKELRRLIKMYLADENESHLHAVRISVRRMRYQLEIFYRCFRRKDFDRLYGELNNIQIMTGKIRDNTICMNLILKNETGDATQIRKELTDKIAGENLEAQTQLRPALRSFIQAQKGKKFLKRSAKN